MKNLFSFKSNYFKFLLFFILNLLVVFSSKTAFAHKVVIFAWAEGNTVFTESQFPDGKKVVNGQVQVFDPENNLLLKGNTDKNGDFSFKVPKVTDLNIVLIAGMGHRGQWKLSEKEIKSAMGISSQETDTPQAKDTTESPASTAETVTPTAAPGEKGTTVTVNEKQLEQMMEKVLDKKIHPITEMLAQMQEKGPSANDIFGGIGYILGLMGVAAYILSRKKS